MDFRIITLTTFISCYYLLSNIVLIYFLQTIITDLLNADSDFDPIQVWVTDGNIMIMMGCPSPLAQLLALSAESESCWNT